MVRVPGDLPGTPSSVTIGNFYAVHKGHQALIRKVRRHAEELGALATVVTFEPHPQQVLRGEAPAGLVTAAEKLQLLEEAGIAQTVILKFTRELSRVEPEEFIEQILVKDLQTRAIVVGSDFRFGRFARGDVTMLRSFGRKLGFEVEGARMSSTGGRRISSTAIRHALAEGDVKWAAAALGRPYSLSGTIVHGAGRGHSLGFPTANLKPAAGVCVPGPAIYAGATLVGGQRLVSAISVGTNPTFGENPLSVEAFVLDYRGDLYGQQAAFEFVARLRDHVAFAGPRELNEAISADVEQVRTLLR
ncbi:MAG: bifunctional riboflavin kinase/FAD synthetase [Actinomycetota bacterium]